MCQVIIKSLYTNVTTAQYDEIDLLYIAIHKTRLLSPK